MKFGEIERSWILGLFSTRVEKGENSGFVRNDVFDGNHQIWIFWLDSYMSILLFLEQASPKRVVECGMGVPRRVSRSRKSGFPSLDTMFPGGEQVLDSSWSGLGSWLDSWSSCRTGW